MKRIGSICIFCILTLQLCAQEISLQKPSSLEFHVFYNDFKTAQQIRTSSLSSVLKNGNWSSLSEMQMGFGFSYLKGIRQKLDLIVTLDGSSIDYLFKDGSTNGSSRFLLDMNVGLHAKLFTDTSTIVPYLYAGSGFSYYKKLGFYFPVGLGLQFNLFKEAFILTNMQYRFAANKVANDHFYYTVGIGTSIGKRKKLKPVVITRATIIPVQPIEVKLARKNLRIKVIDEQTGIILPNVVMMVNSESTKLNGITNADGEAIFDSVLASDYLVSGVLNGIFTTTQHVLKSNFDNQESEISITLMHNDARFTLSGIVEDKNANIAAGSDTVNVSNTKNGNVASIQIDSVNGRFRAQLEANSDFIVFAKRAGFISNIENLSTIGLDRNATLYVNLVLGIEVVKRNQAIKLANIYYAVGSAVIGNEASNDLEKLVRFLKDNPSVQIEIASHTDSKGSAANNSKLSQRRAEEVVNYLQRRGISIDRLAARGYGESRLLNNCADGVICTEVQHAENRRTEFKITGGLAAN